MTRPLSRLCACLCAMLLTSSAWGQATQPGPPTPSGNLAFTPSKIYNITDPAYGAKCDGATDDAAAINAALTAAGIGGGRVIMPAAKTCAIASRLSISASNVSLECSSFSAGVNGAVGSCVLKWIGGAATDAATAVSVSAPGTGYVPGDQIPLAAGTIPASGGPATVIVVNTQVVSATAGTNGVGCTNGTYTVTGTTGSVGAGTLFQANITVTSNVPVVNSISRAGNYTGNPTAITNEPVTGVAGCGTQPKLSVVMGALNAAIATPGYYTALPTNPVAQASTTGVGVGATFTMTWGAAMMQVTAISGAAAGILGDAVEGVSFVCNGTGTAAYGLIIQSIRFGDFGQIFMQHCSTAATYIGGVALQGVANNGVQNNAFHNFSIVQSSAGDGYGIWENWYGGNASFNVFTMFALGYLNSSGVYLFGADNETFIDFQGVRPGGGTAPGLLISSAPTFASDSNKFIEMSAGAGGVTLAGTDTVALAAVRQQFIGYDAANSIPNPVAGTGASWTLYSEKGILYRAGLENGTCGASESDVLAAMSRNVSTASLYCYNASQAGITLDDGTGIWTFRQDASHNLNFLRSAGSGHVVLGGGLDSTVIGGNAPSTGQFSNVGLGTTGGETKAAGELAFDKIAASGSAPGAMGAKVAVVCGTNAGSAKLIMYAGTSTTPVTVIDNVGSGVTGC